ncbi:hypothetical protein DSO57_1015337 [Entomophthora muscae]|uniref:Uncharacterized protein n=1 Tax=Entomophthora muscae TaxID=34485 RepID=A0ACC2UQ79_9FUNG|nr:hypothetical protein DSO57_1015337 [Entomophthora muscae]
MVQVSFWSLGKKVSLWPPFYSSTSQTLVGTASRFILSVVVHDRILSFGSLQFPDGRFAYLGHLGYLAMVTVPIGSAIAGLNLGALAHQLGGLFPSKWAPDILAGSTLSPAVNVKAPAATKQMSAANVQTSATTKLLPTTNIQRIATIG